MTTKPAKTEQQLYDEAVEQQFETWLEESHTKEALKGVPLYEHKLPSGRIFKVRNLSPEFLIQSGAVPVGDLSNDVLKKEPLEALTPEQRQQKAVEAYEKLTDEERLEQARTVARQIRYICVEPRVSMGPVNGHRNAVQLSRLSTPDFGSLAARSNPMGGASAHGLRTFRKKRR